MGRIIVACFLVLGVLAVVQGIPTNKNRNRANLVQLLKKALIKIQERQGGDCNDRTPERNLESLEYLYTMPNSKYLQEITFRRMRSPLPTTPLELTDFFELDQVRTTTVETMAFNMLPFTVNPETFATAVTMEMVPIILDGRMRCPSTVLNKFMIRLWDEQYQQFVSTDSTIYAEFEKTAKAVFPLFETMPDELDWFLRAAVEKMHSTLFNDTAILTLAQELRDVAEVAHYMYNSFYAQKVNAIDTVPMPPLMTVINDAINKADVKCQTGEELFRQHEISNWILINEFEDLEVEHVCHYVGEFIYNYMSRRVEDMPGVDINWLQTNLQWEHLHDLCFWIKDFIHEGVFPAIRYYHILVENKQTDEFLGLFGFLDIPQKRMLEEVLMRLGWPASSTTFVPPNGPLVTPEVPVVTPDAPVVTPVVPVATPDAPTVNPVSPASIKKRNKFMPRAKTSSIKQKPFNIRRYFRNIPRPKYNPTLPAGSNR